MGRWEIEVDDTDFMLKKSETELEFEYPDYYSKYSLVTFRADVPYARPCTREGHKTICCSAGVQQPPVPQKNNAYANWWTTISKNLIIAVK